MGGGGGGGGRSIQVYTNELLHCFPYSLTHFYFSFPALSVAQYILCVQDSNIQ